MSTRIEKVNRLIKEEFGKIISREIDFPRGSLVTITSVETSSDLEHAKVKVSVLPKEKQEEILKILEKKIYFLQRALDRKLVMRYVPKIRFVLDRTQEKVERIEKLLKEL